jgi:hypothetical protein
MNPKADRLEPMKPRTGTASLGLGGAVFIELHLSVGLSWTIGSCGLQGYPVAATMITLVSVSAVPPRPMKLPTP